MAKMLGFVNRKDIFKELVDITCEAFAVEPEELLSKSRLRTLVWGRAAIMFAMKIEHRCTFAFTGDLFGQDHATALHNINKTKKRLIEGEPSVIGLMKRLVPNKTVVELLAECDTVSKETSRIVEALIEKRDYHIDMAKKYESVIDDI